MSLLTYLHHYKQVEKESRASICAPANQLSEISEPGAKVNQFSLNFKSKQQDFTEKATLRFSK
jgi:hypothetical protein